MSWRTELFDTATANQHKVLQQTLNKINEAVQHAANHGHFKVHVAFPKAVYSEVRTHCQTHGLTFKAIFGDSTEAWISWTPKEST